MNAKSFFVEGVVKESSELKFASPARQWQEGLEERMSQIVASQDQGMGFMEEAIQQASRQAQREVLEKSVQAKADQVPPHCPKCQKRLSRLEPNQERTIQSRFGPIVIRRTHGWCKKCRQWFYPADLVLGINKNAAASPSLQEMAALTVSKMPVADAVKVIERLAGVKISPATLDREARRQGGKARGKRQEMDELKESIAGYKELAKMGQKQASQQPYTFIIELDAWNIRERDDWGQTEQLRQQGIEPSRWHWVYGGTCFSLDKCSRKERRAMISQRGYVMTREGIDALSQQLQAEALRQGLSQAAKVLVIADGALWIWNLIEDAFSQAEQRLDFFHAAEHLWAVARQLYGQGTEAAQQWVEPLLEQLRQSRPIEVIHSLRELEVQLKAKDKQLLQRTSQYLESNQHRMDYRQAKEAGEPIGSGAIESTCRQYQCRFKRPGQFWSKNGDEGLMALETFWRNGRWHLLFPHSDSTDPSKN